MNKQDAYAYFGYSTASALEADPRLLERAIQAAKEKGDSWKLTLLKTLWLCPYHDVSDNLECNCGKK